MRHQWKVYLLALSFALGATAKTLAGEPTFTTIDFPGATTTGGRDVAPEGDAFVGEYDDAAGHHGFLLEDGNFTSIDVPGAVSTDAHGINARGDIVGVYRTALPNPANECLAGACHAYLLSEDGLTSFDFPDATSTSANGINDRGDIVGGYCTITRCPIGGEGNRGFLLSGGEFTTIDFPGATLTEAWKINSHGDIVGVYQEASGKFHGFLLSGGEFTSIDVPGAAGTLAFGINARGDIVGSYCVALPCGPGIVNHHGFLLSGGEFTSFDFPGAQFTRAHAINPRGDIAGLYRDFSGARTGNHAFLISKGERRGRRGGG